jgi:hypothetical protein
LNFFRRNFVASPEPSAFARQKEEVASGDFWCKVAETKLNNQVSPIRENIRRKKNKVAETKLHSRKLAQKKTRWREKIQFLNSTLR